MSPTFKYFGSVALIAFFFMAGIGNGMRLMDKVELWPALFLILDIWLCSYWHTNAMKYLAEVRAQRDNE